MILGEKKLLDSLGKLSQTDLYGAVAKGIKTVQEEAKAGCPTNHGELRESIYTSIENSEGTVRGICYTNKSYAAYVEFGTGPVGQENHEGTAPDTDYAYGQTGWLIPQYAMSQKEAEKYGFKIIRNKKGEIIGYATNGQAAHPYIYPALKNNEQEIERIFEEAVKKKI
ncbi:MAG: HK97-gp10 family putative phage morphogenesis protein [Lachnospiraceae bacterium]